MEELVVATFGPLPDGLAAECARFLGRTTGRPARFLEDPPLDPEPGFDPLRVQYAAGTLREILSGRYARPGRLVLGLTEVDLFSPVFTFVFGEAVLNGDSAVVSLFRLRPERYGLAPDDALVLARARREALHETGHLLGLLHCRDPLCVMRFSGAAEEVDLKDDAFCPACESRAGLGEDQRPRRTTRSASGDPPRRTK